MRKTQRKRTHMEKPTNNLITSSFDVWLQRLGHISQALLGIFTIAGFFFIVIPIYQKELLSESIAKSELKLRDLQIKIDQSETVERLREVQEMLYSLQKKCSKFTHNLLTYKIGGTISEDKFKEFDEREVLEFNAEECWENTYDKLKLGLNLKKSELKKLDDDVLFVVREIKTNRPLFKFEYDNYKLSENELALIDSDPYDELERLAIFAGLTDGAIIEGRKNSALEAGNTKFRDLFNCSLIPKKTLFPKNGE